MAEGFHLFWFPLLFSCVTQASDNIGVINLTGAIGHPQVDRLFSKSQIVACYGTNELKSDQNNSQHDNEAFELRSELRLLKLQFAKCSSTISAITNSHQIHLENKMNELLDTYDDDTFLVLKVIALTSEVKTLQNKIKHATNLNTTTDIDALQSKLQVKTNELIEKMTHMKMNRTNAALIADFISQLNQSWDLEQAKSRGQNSGQGRVWVLQEQMEHTTLLLGQKEDKDANTLTLMFKQSVIAEFQRHINTIIDQSRAEAADHQRQWKQKVALLKKKIIELNSDENNIPLTKDILTLQKELMEFRQLMFDTKKRTDSKLAELQATLENHKKTHDFHQKRLEEEDYAKAQLIFRFLSIMKELRELQAVNQDQLTTDTSPSTTLQTLLQTREKEYANAQAEISELQRKLQLKSEERCGAQEKHEELDRYEGSNAELVLNVISLHNDIWTLKSNHSSSVDPDRPSELLRQIEKKQSELNSKTEEIERRFTDPKKIFTVIELQNEIWDQLHAAAKGVMTDGVDETQSRVDDLISKISDDSAQLILEIMTLQTQLENNNLTEFLRFPNDDLTTKRQELQKRLDHLIMRNQTEKELILKATNLQKELRNSKQEKENLDQTDSVTITELKKQLKDKEEEHSRDQAEIQSLKNQLNHTADQCSNEQNVKDLQVELDSKIEDLQSKSNTVTSLALQISTLTQQLEELKRQLQKTELQSKMAELQKAIDTKTILLAKKNQELKERSTQPQRLLEIIALQMEIERLANVAVNDSDYFRINALQDQMNSLIEGIQDEKDENTKLMFQLMAQKDEIERLRKQEESQAQAELKKIKDLEDELEDIRNQIKERTRLLESSDTRIANLSAQIMELHFKIGPLEDEILYIKETNAENLEEIQNRLNRTERQMQDSERQLNDANAKNYKHIMEIADLKANLKKAQKQASIAAKRDINKLQQQIEKQQRETQKLESQNKNLQREVEELQTCCSDGTSLCDGVQRTLEQCQQDADRLQLLLAEKGTNIQQLEKDLEEQIRDNRLLQNEISELREQQLIQARADELQQQLQEKDARLKQQQQQLENQTRAYNELQEKYKSKWEPVEKLRSETDQNKMKDEEDNTIYTWTITMDPNTTHSRITLSPDKTEMSTGEMQRVIDNPGRFDVNRAALGSTGFLSGRHYWEVSVTGRLCYHLGMASESAQRRGPLRFGPANGYWTIVRDKQGQYRAVDGSVYLQDQMEVSTIGILLEYSKGKISFYNVGARSLMYSFSGQKFTDKLYPFINFCVDDNSPVSVQLLTPNSADWIE